MNWVTFVERSQRVVTEGGEIGGRQRYKENAPKWGQNYVYGFCTAEFSTSSRRQDTFEWIPFHVSSFLKVPSRRVGLRVPSRFTLGLQLANVSMVANTPWLSTIINYCEEYSRTIRASKSLKTWLSRCYNILITASCIHDTALNQAGRYKGRAELGDE